MSKEKEIYHLFKEAKRIVDIFVIARDLKNKGYDAAEVNTVASRKKRELISESNKCKTLVKVIPPLDSTKKGEFSCFTIIGNNMSSGTIEIRANNQIIL